MSAPDSRPGTTGEPVRGVETTHVTFRKRHPRWMRLLLVLVSVVGIVGVLEIGVRIFCPGINFVGESASLFQSGKFGDSFGYLPKVTGTSWGAQITTDRYGFRGVPGPEVLDAGPVPSLLIVGDSVPNGIGVAFPLTLSNLLGRKLSKRIVNTAVTGYSAADYENVVRHFVMINYESLRVERVVLFITLNDLVGGSADAIRTNLGGRGAAAESASPKFVERVDRVVPFNSWLVGRSKFYLLLKGLAYDSSRRWFLADEAQFHDDKRVEALIDNVRSIDRMLASVGLPLTLVVLPYEYQLRDPSTDNWFPQRRLREALGRAGLEHLDLSDAVRAAMEKESLSSEDLFLFNDHCHLSVRGHALVAELLARALSAMRDGR